MLSLSQDFSNIGSWDLDIPTGSLFWTNQIAVLFGYPEGDLETSYENFLGAVHPDDRQAVIDAVDLCIEEEAPYDIEHRVVWPDGTVVWLQERGAVVRDNNGKALRMLGVVQDIDNRKRAEMALIESSEEADRASQAKSQFLTSMSHELRTPLNAVIGFAELLDQSADLSASDRQKFARHIVSAGHQLLQMINGILDLSSIEAGKLSLDIRPVKIAALVAASVEQNEAALENTKQITIENTISDPDLQVLGDSLRIQQVLNNLLSNAIKYNRNQGWVKISCLTQKDGCLRIQIQDSGVGIASYKLPLLFESFERLEQVVGTIPGAGIGLTVSQQLVEAMHGSIGVDSEDGQGSTFWFELPVTDESCVEEESVVATEQSLQPEPYEASRFVVLYIEDNTSSAELANIVLENRPNTEFLTAETAEQGLVVAKEKQPDLILMDIHLPGMDGIDATKILLQNKSTRHIPVIALSADARQATIDQALASGCRAYLTKPIKITDLLKVIDEIHQSKP